jgi:hypothetical protein
VIAYTATDPLLLLHCKIMLRISARKSGELLLMYHRALRQGA